MTSDDIKKSIEWSKGYRAGYEVGNHEYETVLAELENAKHEMHLAHTSDAMALIRERDQLRAELEQLQEDHEQGCRERDKLRAELATNTEAHAWYPYEPTLKEPLVCEHDWTFDHYGEFCHKCYIYKDTAGAVRVCAAEAASESKCKSVITKAIIDTVLGKCADCGEQKVQVWRCMNCRPEDDAS